MARESKKAGAGKCARELTVGVVGTGKMGRPILGHIGRAGFTVRYYDVDPAVRIRGATRAASLNDLAAACDVILVVVGTDAQVEDCFKGKTGLLGPAVRNKIFIVVSTVHPDTLKKVGRAAARKGAKMLDAPVVWGEPGAAKGTLVSYVGGDRRAFGRCRRVIEAYSARGVHFLGPLGSGTVAKTTNNHLMWVCRFASLEALHLASRYFKGDMDALYQALLDGTCSNRCLERISAGGGTPWAKKDLQIVRELARSSALKAEFAAVAARAAVDEDYLAFNREGLAWLEK